MTRRPWYSASLLTLLAALSLTIDTRAAEDFGGGEFVRPDPVPHLSPKQREAMLKELEQTIAQLRAQQVLPPPSLAPLAPVLLDWPLRPAAGLTDYGYHGVSGFFDHDPLYPDSVLDYECGDRTYDTAAGYNHIGTDYFTWPFSWKKMDGDEVEVVAAAPGTIVQKRDGNFDRSCEFNNNTWNTVWVQHADERVAFYGHLKNGSVTTKGVGESVVTGEYLGIVGSSGNSTGPHLHLEIVTLPLFAPDDPYAGPCSTPTSMWIDQHPYYDSAINKVSTHSSSPVFPTCPNPEIPNLKDDFGPGDEVYFAAYYRDQLSGQQSQYTIYQPNGSVFQTWNHSSSAAHYEASYWYWSYTILSGGPNGTWRFEVVYQGETYEHFFTVGANGVPALSTRGIAALVGTLLFTALFAGWRRLSAD